ncbi:MAG TPA: hypothetical protein VMT18_02295, partial [Planctomycetota bacterium]|nr:hypothetical protein [Planctomycetota bacterium]
TVLVYRGTESGTFVLDSSFTQEPLISEIQPIQWTTASGYSGLEIAARSNLGVRVHSRTGTVLFAQLTGTTEHDMAVVRPYVARVAPYTTVETLDKLAIVAPDSSDDEIFRLYGSAGNEQAFSLGEIGVVGMHAGDYDQDGDFDLAISQRSSHRLYILDNLSYSQAVGEKDAADPTFTSDANDRSELRIGEVGSAAMPNNTAQPLLADLTGDGLTDVLMGVHDEDSQKGGDFLYRVRGEVDNTYADEGECPGTFNRYWLYIDGSLSYSNVSGPAVTNSSQLAIEIELNNTWGDLSSANPSDIFLEVTVRKQAECEDEEIELSPVWHHLYSVDAPNGAGAAFLSQSAPLRIGFSIDVDTVIVSENPTVYGYVEFGDKYYMEIRPARYTNGDIWSPFSSEILSFTGEFDTMTNLSCAPTPHLSNDPGAYLDCVVTGETVPGPDDYIAEAYAQANLPAFGGGFLLYPSLSQSVAKAPAGQ